MSRKKLTLTVDEEAIERARRYSTSRGTSISDLVSRFLSSLGSRGEATPTVSRLRGILPPDASLEDYHQHLIEKHTK
jgi:hypothetical protein